MKQKFHLTIIFYAILIIGFIIYSYTQVDLNLTLSSNKYYQVIQQKLTFLGFYQRPLSSILFLFFLAAFFIGYLIVLNEAKNHLTYKTLWKLIALSSILIFAYPAFSHDIFNYMFDARIVTKYGLDPVYFKALDFPQDTWTRFMHWTHRYYPYGQGWLIITLLPSYFGLGKFTLTLFIFKLLFLGFHLTNCVLIQKIVRNLKMNSIFAVAFYALNPLILIEGLVSPHNEVMMLTFVLLTFFWLYKHKIIFPILSILLSFSIKYISIILLPLVLWYKNTNWLKFFHLTYYFWVLALIPVVAQRELYSWYVIPIIGIASLLHIGDILQIITLGVTSGTLAKYIPFILTGEYSVNTQIYETWLFTFAFFGFSVIGFKLWRKYTKL